MRLLALLAFAPSIAVAQPTAPSTSTTTPALYDEYVTANTDWNDTPEKYKGTKMLPPSGWRLMLSDLSVLRVNPIGIETRGRFGMQRRLYASKEDLSKNNFMFVGMYPKLNPASAHLALGGEFQPLSIVNVKATVEVQKYFGTFGFLQSFQTPDNNFSDQTLTDLETVAGKEPQSASVFHVGIAPLLQMKVGNIAIRALFQLDYWDMGIRNGDTVAYEATFDTLLPDRGWTLSTDTDVLYTGRPGLAVGIRHTWVHPFYKSRHFKDTNLSDMENAEASDRFGAVNAHQRIGLFAAYTLRDRGPSRFNKPTVILVASWYLDHRYRTGAPDAMRPDERADDFTSRAFPYLLAGFAFESDLLSVR